VLWTVAILIVGAQISIFCCGGHETPGSAMPEKEILFFSLVGNAYIDICLQ
jgi:hypothetical protein